MRPINSGALLAATLSLTGCGATQSIGPTPHLVESPMLDNLLVVSPGTDVANMSLDTVSFRVQGRCLEVLWNGKAYTPIFQLNSNSIIAREQGVQLPYVSLRYGEVYYVQGPLTPEPITLTNTRVCPPSGLLLRGITPLQNIPQPITPPGQAS